MLTENRTLIFLCFVAALAAALILNAIVGHEFAGNYLWFEGRAEWATGADWLFALLSALGMVLGGMIAVVRSLPFVIAMGSIVSALGLFAMFIELPGFIAGTILWIAAFAMGFAGYPLVIAVIGTVVSARRRLTGMMVPIAVALAVEAFAWPSPKRIGNIPMETAAILLFMVSGLLILGALMLRPAFDKASNEDPVARPRLGRAIGEFAKSSNFWTLALCMFVLGLHTEFLVNYLARSPLAADTWQIPRETQAVAMVGVISFFGLIGAGWFGHLVAAKRAIGGLHLLCVVAVVAFVFVPLEHPPAISLATAIALAWLSVSLFVAYMAADIFGTRYLALLYALFYVAHSAGQVASEILKYLSNEILRFGDFSWYLIIIIGTFSAFNVIYMKEKRPFSVQSTLRVNRILGE